MIALVERAESRRWTTGNNPSVDYLYILTGTADDEAAKDYVRNATPSFVGALAREYIQLDAEWTDTDANDGRWAATVRYSRRHVAQVGESSFAFDTGGGTQHITQSLATVSSHAASGTAPNFGGAIGVTHDSVEGVDIVVPVYSFSETHVFDDAFVTEAYKGALFYLTGKVNSDSFRGLAAGECLFLGAAGSSRGDGTWEITFNFAGSPNRTSIPVGSMTVSSKKGWDYLWVRYADSEDTTAKAIVKKPVAAYVERVYEEASFAGLGI